MVFCHFCGKNNSTIPQTGKVSVSARIGGRGRGREKPGHARESARFDQRTTNQWQATIFTDTGVRASYEFLSCHIVWKSSQRNEFNARITWSYTHLLLNHHSLIPNKSGVHSYGHKNALTTNYTHVSGDIFRRSILVVKGTAPRGVGGGVCQILRK